MHEPVLLKEVIAILSPKKGDSYLDVTAGYGGHSSKILEISQNYKKSVLVDRDQAAIDELNIVFANKEVEKIHLDYYQASEKLAKSGRKFNVILADLGVSSLHLNMASRGFSFKESGPLDMRMDQSQELTADEIVNNWDLTKLEQIIREYGEEPHYRRIARAIVEQRPVKNTSELAKIIARLTPKHTVKHPATRTFQALRIAVNDELSMLTKSLPIWIDMLEVGGRIGIISFHSLEDRIVKRIFLEHSKNIYEADLKVLTKHPVLPSDNEVFSNPRSRSARFRAAVKIKTTERTSDEN